MLTSNVVIWSPLLNFLLPFRLPLPYVLCDLGKCRSTSANTVRKSFHLKPIVTVMWLGCMQWGCQWMTSYFHLLNPSHLPLEGKRMPCCATCVERLSKLKRNWNCIANLFTVTRSRSHVLFVSKASDLTYVFRTNIINYDKFSCLKIYSLLNHSIKI